MRQPTAADTIHPYFIIMSFPHVESLDPGVGGTNNCSQTDRSNAMLGLARPSPPARDLSSLYLYNGIFSAKCTPENSLFSHFFLSGSSAGRWRETNLRCDDADAQAVFAHGRW